MFELNDCASPIDTEYLNNSVLALTTALNERDSYTNDHCDRVCRLALQMGQCFGMQGQGLRELTLAARFHDIGKIGIPDAVLLKPGRLDEQEMAVMRSHAVRGERVFLATGRDDASQIGRLIRHHHEAFDGSGYPDGLAGEQIQLGARILAVVDGFDAMTTTRPYRQPLALDTTVAILQQEAGNRLDPQMVAAFVELLAKQPAATRR
ncbi:HD-GYP domain-containing protein [Stenotrophomonas koreensis]|uniref:HD-GYP domain-containing protein n=1 Tax=Stenotrophomonas koreensis TaxID=266128 RepID=UPI003397CC3C